MALTFQQTDTLERLKHRLDQLDAQDDKLDKKAQDNIQSISIILAFAVAFKFPTLRITGESLSILTWVFAIYLGSVGLSYYVLLPKRWLHPLGDTVALIKANAAQAEPAYYNAAVSAYANAISLNGSVLNLKSRAVSVATLLIGVDIFFIIVLAAIG